MFVLDLSGASRVMVDGAANDLIIRGSGASRARNRVYHGDQNGTMSSII